MILQTAQRKRAKIKMGLTGVSGSGKTMSSLLIARGLCKDYSKVCVIDSENSAELYSEMGSYNVIHMEAPFTPEKYMEAIKICVDNKMEVVIIDSLSHEWEYLLDYHGSLPGNSFGNWSKISPRHNALIQSILQSPLHVISTVRSKSDYVLTDKNGKMVPERVGTKSIQRDVVEFEFTIMFSLDIKNNMSVSKDRTGLFFGKLEFKASIETGKRILDWCNTGTTFSIDDVSKRINDVATLTELLELYKQQDPSYKEILRIEFEQKKKQLLIQNSVQTQLANSSINQNGTDK